MKPTKWKRTPRFETLLDRLVKQEVKVKKLRALTPVEQAKLDQDIAIEHLYYSSKIEGTHLSGERIEKAIHGEAAAPSPERN